MTGGDEEHVHGDRVPVRGELTAPGEDGRSGIGGRAQRRERPAPREEDGVDLDDRPDRRQRAPPENSADLV